MNVMWARWSQRKRLHGVILLGSTAVAYAGAVLLWLIGAGMWTLAPALIACVTLAFALDAFTTAQRYAKGARR